MRSTLSALAVLLTVLLLTFFTLKQRTNYENFYGYTEIRLVLLFASIYQHLTFLQNGSFYLFDLFNTVLM